MKSTPGWLLAFLIVDLKHTHTDRDNHLSNCLFLRLHFTWGRVVEGLGLHRAGGLWPAGDFIAWRILRDLNPWGTGCHHTSLLPHLRPGRYCMAFTCKSTLSNYLQIQMPRLNSNQNCSANKLNEGCTVWITVWITVSGAFVPQIKNTAEVRRTLFMTFFSNSTL